MNTNIDLWEENKRLRKIVSKCLLAIGNGSACSEEASLEFMDEVPLEIMQEVRGLRQTAERLRASIEKAGFQLDAPAAKREATP